MHQALHVEAHATHEHHWEVSWAPMAVAFGLMFLVPIAFSAHFVYHEPLLAIISAGVGTPLLLIGVAKWTYEGAVQTPVKSEISPVGVGVFIIGEILIFLALFASYWTMRIGTGVAGQPWPPAGTPHINLLLPLFMTGLLVASSLTYHYGEHKLNDGRKGWFLVWLFVSIILGAGFLSCTAYEYEHLFAEGFVPRTNQYSTAFYTLTGFHGSHVLVGLLAFAAILFGMTIGNVNKMFVKVAGIYWHFVDVIWLFVASQVYYW